MSIWRAKQFGGPELNSYSKFLGWDADTYILADLVDAVNQNTVVTIAANSEGKSPDLEPYPRPDTKRVDDKPAETLDDFGNKLLNLFGPGIAS